MFYRVYLAVLLARKFKMRLETNLVLCKGESETRKQVVVDL